MRNALKKSGKAAKKTKVAGSRPAAGRGKEQVRPSRTPQVSVTGAEKVHSTPALGSVEQSGFFEKAIALFHAGNFQKAKALFEKAAAGPAREVAHSAKIHARICEQRTNKAAPSLTSADDYYNYGVALLNRRELEAAEKHLERAVNLAPNQDHLYYALALCSGLRGDIQQAHANLKRAIELQPRNRAQARNDPDFADLLQQPLLEELLFPERGHPA
jgi:tetratricopeptide (TPR) repeat protein